MIASRDLPALNHEFSHIQISHGKVHLRVGLLADEASLEALQRENQERRRPEYLDSFDGLFEFLAIVAVPFVLAIELFRSVELPEAVGDGDPIGIVRISLLIFIIQIL